MNDNLEREHLDLLRLDAVRAGEGSAAELAHLAACAACREELMVLKRLEAALLSEEPEAAPVPEAVDAAILEAFRRSRRPKVLRFPVRWLAPAALALAAGLAALVWVPRREALRPTVAARPETAPDPLALSAPAAPAPPPAAAPAEKAAPPAPPAGDVNGDRRLDVLDAYRLALLVEERSPEASGWDANGDGRVDPADADTLARLAVALR